MNTAEIDVLTVEPEKGEQFTPFSPIYISRWDDDGKYLISSELRIDAEIEETIENYIKKLRKVCKKAKREHHEKRSQYFESLKK